MINLEPIKNKPINYFINDRDWFVKKIQSTAKNRADVIYKCRYGAEIIFNLSKVYIISLFGSINYKEKPLRDFKEFDYTGVTDEMYKKWLN